MSSIRSSNGNDSGSRGVVIIYNSIIILTVLEIAEFNLACKLKANYVALNCKVF